MQFQWFGPNLWGDKEGSYNQASDTLHFKWMALWLKAASTRAPCILEFQGRSLCQRWDCNQGFQSSCAFHTSKESLGADPWRTPRSGKMHAEGKGVSVLARDQWWHAGRLWKSVEFTSQLPELPSLLETPVRYPPLHGTHWALTYSTGIDSTFIVVGDYFTKYLVVRKLPNSSSHMWWSRN